jgi:hypothetical protein
MNDEQLLRSLNTEPLSVPEEAQNKLNTFFVSLLPKGSSPEDYEAYSKNNMCLLENNIYNCPFSNFTEAQYVAKHVANITGTTSIVKAISRFEIKVGNCYVKELNGQIVLCDSNKAKTFEFNEARTALSVLEDLNLKPKLVGLHTELFFIYPPAGHS